MSLTAPQKYESRKISRDVLGDQGGYLQWRISLLLFWISLVWLAIWLVYKVFRPPLMDFSVIYCRALLFSVDLAGNGRLLPVVPLIPASNLDVIGPIGLQLYKHSLVLRDVHRARRLPFYTTLQVMAVCEVRRQRRRRLLLLPGGGKLA